VEALEVKTIPMGQGNKIGRIVTWTFLAREEQVNWAKTRWL
jgi:23S rRNA (adenine1618-N6)-methyltransferase